MSRRLAHVLAMFGVALLVSTKPAIAAPIVIFSDFGPGESYLPSPGWTVAGPPGSFQSVATAFTPFADFQFSQIDIALSFASGTNSAIVTLNADSGGVPGGVLMTWNLSGLPPFGTCCAVETLTASSPLLLSSGTRYWVVSNAGTANTFDVWNFNSLGLTGLVMLNNGNGFFVPPHLELGAFGVLGEIQSAVPEPTTLLLTAGGLAWLLSDVSRRARRAKALNTASP